MSVNNCLHVIKITNLQDNEVIPHRFLLLKGRVDGHKCHESHSTISLSLGKYHHEILTSADFSRTGKFKFLVDLGVENKQILLTLSYCNALFQLNIYYKQKQSPYTIQPLIIKAQDECPGNVEGEEDQEEKLKLYQRIVDLNLLLIQAIYAEKLKERSQGRLCFAFNGECQIFETSLSKQEIWQMSENDLWSHFAKEILRSKWGEESNMKFVAFIACSRYLGEEVAKTQDYSYTNIRKHIQGHAACGAGGLALFSSTYFYAWPETFADVLKCFENKQTLDLSKQPDDSNYRKTYGGVYASSLGAVCHEIGHIFDLGHDLDGVMGSNFDYINNVFVVHKLTEHLPQRIVQKECPAPQMVRQRFTQIKKTPARGFLDCYREQKENDSFYFSPNSAIILAYHPWLREKADLIDNNEFEVDFCQDTFMLKSPKYPLKIIEIRTNSNSLVKEWLELQKKEQDEAVFELNLCTFQKHLQQDCYIFIMSTKGHTKKIPI